MKHVAIGLLSTILTLNSLDSMANDTWLDVNLSSNHRGYYYIEDGKRKEFNEKNYGLGISHEIKKDFIDVRMGFFKNSYNKNTFYVGGNIKHNINYNDFFIEPGITAGFVTGYQQSKECNSPICVMLVPNVSLGYKSFRGNIGITPMKNYANGGINIVTMFQIGVKLR